MRDETGNAELGADLVRLLATLDAPAVRIEPITTLASHAPSRRATFAIDLADGRRIKGRRVESAARANEIVALRRHVPAGLIPPILGSYGQALLETWVDGRIPAADAWTPDHLAACGELLARVHAVRVPEVPSDESARTPASWCEPIARHVDELTARGAIDRSLAGEIVRLARRHAPVGRVETGLVHGDLCPENLVLDADGVPHPIDNETMRLDACEYDLARTWYRWPMRDTERAAFEAGYARRRSLDAFDRHFVFWALRVLVDSALFRVRGETTARDVPLSALEQLVAAARTTDTISRYTARHGELRGAAFFASDFHLGMHGRTPSVERERRIVAWLEAVAPEASDVFLLGDTFDFWFEYRRVVPKGFVRFLGALAALSDNGIRVHVFTGNHDRFLDTYLEDEVGAYIQHSPEIRPLKGRTCYIGHGDDRGGTGWRLMSSRVARRAFAALHPDLGRSLADAVFRWHRGSRPLQAHPVTPARSLAPAADDSPSTPSSVSPSAQPSRASHAQRLAEAHPDVDYFITGHSHVPALTRLNDHATHVDVGDWLTHESFAVLDRDGLRLEYFGGSCSRASTQR